MKLMIVLLALLTAGCASGKWYHPSANESRFKQDAMECDYEARKATAGTRSGVQAGFETGDLTTRCMQVRGYVWRQD